MTSSEPREAAMQSSAIVSDDEVYRYSLLRKWDANLPSVMFTMLNGSKADHRRNDPTTTRCIGFARSWGFGGLIITNLYGFRATNPDDMWAAQMRGVDIVGPENDGWITAHAMTNAKLIVAAWGNNGEPGRIWKVQQLLRNYDVYCLGLTAAKQPRHPLYVKAETQPQLWRKASR